ncbi:kinase-like protein [Setomelanomma holmii]|uniref:Kinase-like protein n=1 Tax=Setomelanomma holmii TaxID=210430 RepID=A0A9P4LJD3_9PLEO|nr:kinase-like protein [Setomelanomma holmii]
MAKNGEGFKPLRDSLYRSLVALACVPRVWQEYNESWVDQIEQRFFPAGTAEAVLTLSTLEQLFALIVATRDGQSLSVHPVRLAHQFEDRKLHTFLAILITSKCDIEPLISFTRKFVAPPIWTDADKALAELPSERRDSLRAVLGDEVAVDFFFKGQHDFFAPIIGKNKEIRGSFRRLPYVKQKLIGQGSFGRIFEVEISPHHFQDDHGMSNNHGLRLARKDFELNAEDKAHEKERDVLREIVRNAKKHNNIMKSLGSLEIGTTYSIFMPLADCDLKQYMELHPDAPATPQQKAQLVQSAVGLAGAIVYLHEELESPAYEKLSCFHMDLKPQNILVVNDPVTGEQHWKLSDFNMSRVKMQRKPTDELLTLRRRSTFSENPLEINKLFKRRIPNVLDASVTEYTINRRGAGTYLSPEACIDGHRIQAESDTWSLGCVISVVFTYLYGGQPAVSEFGELRYKKGLDRFFTFSRGDDTPRLSDAQVNDAVKRWHRQLRMDTRKRDAGEGSIFDDLIKFIGQKVLIIDPKQRQHTSASDIRDQLIIAFQAYRNMTRVGPASPKSPKSRFSIPGIRRVPWRRRSEVEADSLDWRFSCPGSVRLCAFGPNALPLVCVTDRIISVHSLEHVLLSNDADNFDDDFMTYGQASPNNEGRHWSPNIGVTTQYILATTDHHEFDCYFYHISDPGNHNTELELIHHWELKLPRVWKLALSPDAQYAAFVLCHDMAHQQNGSVYISRLDWNEAAHLENSNPSSPLGRPIALPCPAEDVCELRFSKANGLYVVTKPRHSNSVTGNVMHIYACAIKHEGRDDLLQGLFTCFAPFNHDLAFAILSQEKRVLIRAWNLGRYAQSSARGYRLLQILLDQDDQQILAFGTREAHNDLQLLTFPATNTKEEIDIKAGVKLQGMTYHSRFVASTNTTSTGSITRRSMLIAILEGSTIRIARHDLGT